MSNTNDEANEKSSLRGKVSGSVQKIIGEIEEVGGALTGDPTTQAEGQFNVEVGEIREELDEPEEPAERDTDDARI